MGLEGGVMVHDDRFWWYGKWPVDKFGKSLLSVRVYRVLDEECVDVPSVQDFYDHLGCISVGWTAVEGSGRKCRSWDPTLVSSSEWEQVYTEKIQRDVEVHDKGNDPGKRREEVGIGKWMGSSASNWWGEWHFRRTYGGLPSSVNGTYREEPSRKLAKRCPQR